MTLGDWGFVLAAVGLALSFFTLWWSSLRPAKLCLGSGPPSYGADFHVGSSSPPLLTLRFPIVVQNDGARTGVVAALRLDGIPAEWRANPEVFSHSMWDEINPRGGTERFFEPIAVRGGETVVRICQFNLSGVTVDAVRVGVHELQLSMPKRRWWLARNRPEWSTLGRFMFHVTEHERRGFKEPNAHFNGLRTELPHAPES